MNIGSDALKRTPLPNLSVNSTQLSYHPGKIRVGENEVTVTVDVTGSKGCGFTHACTYCFNADGSVTLKNKVTPYGKMPVAIPRPGHLAAGELLFVRAVLQYGAPAAGTGVAGAGAVGVDGYCFHGRPPWWVFELDPWSRCGLS